MSAPSRAAFRPLFVFLLLAAVSIPCDLASRLSAAEPSLQESTSLQFVPANAEAYYSLFRLGEMVRSLQESNAYAAIKEMPYYQLAMGGMQIAMQSNESYGKIRAELRKPENQQLTGLLTEMASEEVFVYYGNGASDFFLLAQEINFMSRFSGALGQLEGLAEGGDAQEIARKKQQEQITAILEILTDEPERLQVPPIVVGFRIRNAQAATDQLARLEKLAAAALQEYQPELATRLKQVKIGGDSYLEMQLDGSLIPWDELRKQVKEQAEEEQVIEPEQLEKLIEQIKLRTLVVDLGIHDDYVILSLGASNKHLKQLGKGKLLHDRPEFALVREQAGKRLSSISYVSKKMVETINLNKGDLKELATGLNDFLPETELDEETQQELAKDITELAGDLKQLVVKPGAMVAVDYYTERGIEGFKHDWSENPNLDGSQPLPILQHVGGHPWLLVAGRSAYRPQDYELAVKWIKRIYYYSDKLARKELETDKDKALYQQATAAVLPLAARLDKANRELLIPGMKDGQGAFLLDSKTASHQWHSAMPPSAEALPLIEPAILFGVSDADKVRQACSEYYQVINEAIAKVRELSPENLPEFRLPNPVLQDVPDGQIYGYPLPAEWDVDAQIVPNAGLNKTVAVLSLVPQHTRRLLIGEPLTIGGPLANTDRPMAAAIHFHFAGLVDAVRPWIDYGVMMNGLVEHQDGLIAEEEAQLQGEANEPLPETTRGQIRTLLKVLSCFRGVTAVTTVEKGVTVTHYESHYQDLPEPQK